MKSKVLVGLLMGLSCLALMYLTAADNVSIKFAKGTKEFVNQESIPMFTLPSHIEVQGTEYLLDFSHKPDLNDCKTLFMYPGAGEMRYDVTGSLEFRPEKSDKSNSIVVPVVVVKKLSSRLIPFKAEATLERQHYFSRRSSERL